MILARYIYHGDIMEDPIEYSCAEDFLSDLLEDEDIIYFLNQMYGDIDIPCVGVKPAGDVIFQMLNGDSVGSRPDWDALYDEILQMEVEYVEDELVMNGRMIYREYELTDTDFSEEEEEEE